MPVNTPRGYPHPVPADPIDTAGDIQRLAEAVDADAGTTWDTLVIVNDKVDAMLRPVPPATAHIVMPGGTVNTAESTVGTFTVPKGGLWLIGYSATIAAGSGYAFIEIRLAGQNGFFPLVPMQRLRYFDGGLRQSPVGLTLTDLLADEIVHVRALTFAATATIEEVVLTTAHLRP